MEMDKRQPERLDQALVERGLAPTRSRARDLVLRGHVTVDGRQALKPSLSVAQAAHVEVSAEASDVSRGAVKLRAALEAFGFQAADRICLDIGASTGGFTQTLLAAGAAKVYAVDVGRDQLAAALRTDARVVNLEATDARALTADHLAGRAGAIVADVSFVALSKVLGAPLALAERGAWLIVLVKPQFEAGRDAVGKGGIVRDDAVRRACVDAVQSWLAAQPGWRTTGVIPSPIAGGSGNQEFLIGAVNDA